MADFAIAIDPLSPACPTCGNVLPSEHRSWHTDCRAHLTRCTVCEKPVLAVFCRQQPEFRAFLRELA